ncbi:hypothetical protein SI65_04259 [Aspergillus cristatus]|uniref:Ribokinase n=1 Tax=Aspergillus cristatus TaxID=573508 RepID=A0A1E3BLD7_ASPCR|nr:hypothetical protein SI65_04259 [Aspergillus cristatus]
MPPLIRVIGSLNVDMVSVTPRFPSPGETITASSYFMSAGGKGANQAVACGRTSRPKPTSPNTPSTPSTPIDIEMLGAVGALDGHFDALLKPTLEKSGVDTSRVRIIPDAYTGVAVIIVDESAGGENRICFSPGANYKGMQPVPEVLGLGLAAPVPDVIVLQGEIPKQSLIGTLHEIGAFKQRNRKEGKQGIEIGPDVVFNPAPAPPGGLRPEDGMNYVDHLIMNETEAEIMSPSEEELESHACVGENRKKNIAAFFHGYGTRYVIITLGSKGSWYSACRPGAGGPANGVDRFIGEIPADKVSKVLDTTAAGDTFVGAYAVEIARWREARRAAGKAGVDITEGEMKERYETVTEQAMRLATKAAARCVERQGAMDSIPWEDEL